MRIRKVTDELIRENAGGETTLYRLVSVPHGQPLVVNTKEPGKFYFSNEKALDPSLLKNKGGDIHVIKVTTPSSNIDSEASKQESESHGKKLLNAVVVLEDPSKAKIMSIEPYKKAA
jgi:hypothetical protein